MLDLRHGVPVHTFGPGVLSVDGHRTAILICHEQLLTLPMLSSLTQHPNLIIAVANDHWAAGPAFPNFSEPPLILAFISAMLGSMTQTPQPSLARQMASQAEFIVNNLKQTDYTYTENIDVDSGVYDCDCSGFVGFVLERAAPDHYAIIPKEANQLRPRAFEYYDFFSSLTPESTGGWRQINFLCDARRGDIIAWRFAEIEEGHDTGHVFFAAETPVIIDSGIFAIRVYDSAAEPHFDDTRGNEDGEFESGVGSGFINFTVDDSGRPVAFQFAPSEDFVTLPIAIGRVELLP
jgi:hypothetical protein